MVLLCALLRYANDAEAAALAPKVFSLAWASGAYHLRFAALGMLTGIRSTATAATAAAVTELLDEVHTDDPFVSTALVDALHIYGKISSPCNVRDITQEIRLLLADPQHPNAHARAKGILVSRFEDVIAAPFTEAVEALEPAERIALTVLAVREGDTSFFTDVFLKELIRSQDPAALPAFRYWASHLELQDPFRQSAVGCHLLGIEGCATRLAAPPPLLADHAGKDADAWRCYGQILFWLSRPGPSGEERTLRCAPLWDGLTTRLLDAAVDPFHQFPYAAQFAQDIRTSALGRIVDAFPSQTRTVLHHALTSPERLTSLFSLPLRQERGTFVMRLLARSGDHSSLPLLRTYLNHPLHSAAAADTIRDLNNRIAENR